MAAAAKKQEQEIWLGVEDAAKLMGIKPRRMLDYADKITSTRVPNPRSGKSVLMFAQDAVEQFTAERRRIASAGLGKVAPRGNEVMTLPHLDARAVALPAVDWEEARRRRLTIPPWLTLREASVYVCLPESHLLAMVQNGKLPCLDVGVRPGGRYRVKRSDLAAIAGECIR